MKKVLYATVSFVSGIIAAGAIMNKINSRQEYIRNNTLEAVRTNYNIVNQWLMLRQAGESLSDYFEKNKYRNIVIYGMGELGNRLYEEIKNTNIHVLFAIDKRGASTYSEINVYKSVDDVDTELIKKADAVVITATYAFEEIKNDIVYKVNSPIVSIEKVILEN